MAMRILEQTKLYAGIAIQLVDDHTAGPPFGPVRIALDASDAAGAFFPTDIQAVITAGSAIVYPWLERRANAASLPPRNYRVRIDADFYRPFYRASADGIVVSVAPYDDVTPPATVPAVPALAVLLPSPNYPFAPETAVVRGIVVDSAGAPVADALVQGGNERTLTGVSGDFALPLRWAQSGAPIAVDATDRAARTGSITIQLPNALQGSQRITVN